MSTYDGLTPTDVAQKRLTVARGGRDGYDMEEVDSFLDEVERSLGLCFQANEQTNAALAQTEIRLNDSVARTHALEEQVRQLQAHLVEAQEQVAEAQENAARQIADAEAASQARYAEAQTMADNAGVEVIRVETVPEASQAAVRLLAHATASAEALTQEAEAERDAVVSSAQEEASATLEQAAAEAEARLAQAGETLEQAQAEAAELRATIHQELETLREEELDAIVAEKEVLTNEVVALREFEASLREGLQSWLNDLQVQVNAPLTQELDGPMEEILSQAELEGQVDVEIPHEEDAVEEEAAPEDAPQEDDDPDLPAIPEELDTFEELQAAGLTDDEEPPMGVAANPLGKDVTKESDEESKFTVPEDLDED